MHGKLSKGPCRTNTDGLNTTPTTYQELVDPLPIQHLTVEFKVKPSVARIYIGLTHSLPCQDVLRC